MRRSSDRVLPWLILTVAVAVRLVLLVQTRKVAFYYHPILDSGFFHQWAGFKLATGWPDMAPTFREPLYPYFLATIFTMLRQSLVIVRLVQCVLAGLTAVMVYWSARMLYGRVVGAIAGGLATLYVPSVFFSSEINETTLVVFLAAASACALIRVADSRPYLNASVAGLLLGGAFLARFTTIAALPAWVVHLLVAREARLRRATAVLVACFVAVPLAYQVFLVRGDQHAVVPLRASWQAYLGSGEVGGRAKMLRHDIPIAGSDGPRRAIVGSDWMEGQADAFRLARVETGAKMDFGAVARHWWRRTAADFRSSPGRYLRNYVAKVGLLWGVSEPPANVHQGYMSRYSFLLRNVLFSFAVVAPLGLVGLALRGKADIAFLLVFLPAYSLLVSVFLVSDADKMLLTPFLSIGAAATLHAVYSRLREANVTKALAYVAVSAIVGVLLYALPKAKVDEPRELVLLGDIYREEALFDKAEEAYGRAVSIAPTRPEIYISMSKVQTGAWKAQEALDALAKAPEEATRHPRFVVEKASLLFMTGRYDDALNQLASVRDVYSYEPRLHEVMGVSLLSKGETDAAISELSKELEYFGGSFVTLSALGKAKLDKGDLTEAIANLESAFSLNSSNAAVAMQLADAYTRQGEHIKACEKLSKVLATDPGNMAARFKFANCLYRAERYGDALKHFKEMSTFYPNNPDILLNLGTVYAAMDSTDRAVETWQSVLKFDPANQDARQNLSTLRAGHE